jgi:hypothetical protein
MNEELKTEINKKIFQETFNETEDFFMVNLSRIDNKKIKALGTFSQNEFNAEFSCYFSSGSV